MGEDGERSGVRGRREGLKREIEERGREGGKRWEGGKTKEYVQERRERWERMKR